MQSVKLVIVDLDDTLFNWFEQWHASFEFLLHSIEKKVVPHGTSLAQLKAEIKTIHENAETSEYTFLIDELPSILELFPDENPRDVFSEELKQFKEIRMSALSLYPGVLRTLQALRKKSVRIVAYTESMEYHTVERIRALELDGVIDLLYSRDDHGSPAHIEKERLRTEPHSTYSLTHTEHRKLSVQHRKPSPEIIDMIVSEAQLQKSECVYVGDSRPKDIAMANAAGITSVLIEHPNSKLDDPRYELLRDVTHWTPDEVAVEKVASDEPRYHISTFSELLALFDFGDSNGANEIGAWEKSVDVQMHFNDIELRIRSLYASVLVGVIAGTGAILATVDDILVDVGSFSFNVSLLSFLAIIVSTLLFYMMDRHWYHRFLQGAVMNALAIENRSSAQHGLSLTKKIGEYSRFETNKWSGFYVASFLLNKTDGRELRSRLVVSSDNRLEMFYMAILKPTILFLGLFLLLGGIQYDSTSIISFAVGAISDFVTRLNP